MVLHLERLTHVFRKFPFFPKKTPSQAIFSLFSVQNSPFFWFLHGLPETLDGHIWLIFGILHHYGHISRAFFHFFRSTIFWPDFASWKLHFGHFLLFSGDLWGRAVVALMAGGDVFLFFLASLGKYLWTFFSFSWNFDFLGFLGASKIEKMAKKFSWKNFFFTQNDSIRKKIMFGAIFKILIFFP